MHVIVCDSSHRRKAKNESTAAAGVSIMWESLMCNDFTGGGHFSIATGHQVNSLARGKHFSISHFLYLIIIPLLAPQPSSEFFTL